MDSNGQNTLNIAPNKDITQIDWSPEGTRLAFAARNDGIYVVDANGGNLVKVMGTNPCGSPIESPSWSPDGQKIVFACSGRVWLMNGNGTGLAEISVGSASGCGDWVGPCSPTSGTIRYIKWAPDGTKMSFEATITGSNTIGVYVMNTDGTNVRMIKFGGREPAWSPDSQRIALRFGSPPELYVISVNAMTVTQLTGGGNTSYPTWSPDGGWIAFYSNRTPNGIWAVSTDRINGNIQFLQYGNAPAWRPIVSQVSPTPTPVATATPTSLPTATPTLSASPTPTRTVTPTATPVIPPTPTATPTPTLTPTPMPTPTVTPTPTPTLTPIAVPPGKLAFLGTDGSGLWVMDSNGQNAVNIVPNKDVRQFDWSPEGSRLALALPDGIYVVDSTGANLVKIMGSNPCGQAYSPSWSPDGQRIAFICSGFLSIMAGNGDNLIQLSTNLYYFYANGPSAKWSPDGATFALQGLGPYGFGTYLVNADGSGLRKILGGDALEPDWSTGNRLVYRTGSPPELYSINVNVSGTVQLTSGGNASLPSSSPDGGWIAFYSNRTPNGIWVVSTDRLNGNLQFIHSGNAPAWKP